jgi:hypothetical protein
VHWADLLADRSARRWLQGIANRLEPGWRALAAEPALWRVFEGHESAVRDAVRVEDEMVPRPDRASTLVLIAGHAHDVWTEAARADRLPPEETTGWTSDEWAGLRLLACYRLAAAEPHGPKLSRAAAALRPVSAEVAKKVR